MAVLKCKMCGGDLNVVEGIKIVECEFCGTTQTVPNSDDEKKTNLFNRANRLRIGSEFDRAAGIYEGIIGEFPEESEAYWGLCLCKYGIEYVDDPRTAEKVPTCHRTSFESIFDDDNYKKAVSNADPVAQRVYQEEASAIDTLQKDILDIVHKEKPFDVFICYKESDDIGNRTVDSVIAQDIYDSLTDRGFKVFFARITLEDKLGQEYEPYIFAALNSAKVMLAIGTKEEYYNAVWVKNEWSRYLALMKKDRSKMLIPCYRDIDPYDMPPEFKNLQGQDMAKLGFMQDLTRGITKIIKNTADFTPSTPSASTGAMTKRGYFFLEDKDFVNAYDYFEKALDENPEDSKAYVGKVLAALHLSTVEELNDGFYKLYENKDFERAIRFASGADKVQLEEIKDTADKKWLVKCLTVGLKNYSSKKQLEELENQSKIIFSQPTPDGYRQIAKLYEDFYNHGGKKHFAYSRIESYKRQAEIITVLSDGYSYSASDIAEKDRIYPRVSLFTYERDLEQMAKDGSVKKNATGKYEIIGAAEKKAENERKRKYDSALQALMSCNTESEYLALSEVFASFGDYEDALSKVSICKQLAVQKAEEAKAEAERIEHERLEQEKRKKEAEAKKAAEEAKRQAEIAAHNGPILKKISDLEQEKSIQDKIYSENASKIFGAGAKAKKMAKAEIIRLNSAIDDLKKQLK